jgi:hypothetical protein
LLYFLAADALFQLQIVYHRKKKSQKQEKFPRDEENVFLEKDIKLLALHRLFYGINYSYVCLYLARYNNVTW